MEREQKNELLRFRAVGLHELIRRTLLIPAAMLLGIDKLNSYPNGFYFLEQVPLSIVRHKKDGRFLVVGVADEER